jgi:TetR/AcrR family transcriptional repressor of nem operon
MEQPSTRERLVRAGIGLALDKGFADTTIDEVCSAAALSKGAFFHYFRNKEALGHAELERWIADSARDYGAAPFLGITDPLERLYAYVDFTIERTISGPLGCLVGVFTQELWQSQPALRESCAHAFDDWAGGLAALIEDAKTHHAPTASFEPRALALHFIATFEGALILARAFQQPRVVEERLLFFKDYLRRVFAEPNAS